MLRLLLAAITFILLTAMPCARAASVEQPEANKETVAAFEDAALNQKDFEAASKYLGPRYTQHNPNVADGPEGLKGFITFLKDKFPNNHSEIKRIFASRAPGSRYSEMMRPASRTAEITSCRSVIRSPRVSRADQAVSFSERPRGR
jgi:hypothetical protein